MPTMRRPRIFGGHATGEPLTWAGRLTVREARSYWVSVCLSSCRPYARPVWGIWLDDAFWFSTASRLLDNVSVHPDAVVHLESADEAIIVEGAAQLARDLTSRQSFVDLYNAKYGWNLAVGERGVGNGEGAEGEVVGVDPYRVHGWHVSDISTATRWDFPPRDL